jgi:hypothetical protein
MQIIKKWNAIQSSHVESFCTEDPSIISQVLQSPLLEVINFSSSADDRITLNAKRTKFECLLMVHVMGRLYQSRRKVSIKWQFAYRSLEHLRKCFWRPLSFSEFGVATGTI